MSDEGRAPAPAPRAGARRIARVRAEAIRALRAAERSAQEWGGRLVVFGSLVEGGFDERSDIDVALFDLPRDREADIEAEVDTLLSLEGFEVDVVRARSAGSSLKNRILIHGCDAGDLV